MLRFTMELVPHGDEARKKTLGTIEVFNDGSGSPWLGSYGFRRFSESGALIATGGLGEFKRADFNAWRLFQGVLDTLFPDKAEPWRDGAPKGALK